VLDQTFENFRLIILDDGSSDPLVQQICLDASYDERVQYERFNTTLGQRRLSCRYAANVNWGVANTDSEFVTFLAGDDYYLPERLERMVAKLDEGHDVVYGSQLMIDEFDSERGLRSAHLVLDDPFHRVDYNSVMVRREVFLKCGGFPTAKGLWRDADSHAWRAWAKAGYPFHPVDDGLGPCDVKRYREDSVDARVIRGETPWA
jgi:glycosyltransferase involved in cell wall biosynthesis